ncbi:hypothetical protein [Bosea sp. 124]|uniref:hypothetical protein n=1 Tax=Bosea sp. 124 TaxID=2135642 RepID=UPI0011B1D069|nr:hypothetical protein [Bosea sp. 124]
MLLTYRKMLTEGLTGPVAVSARTLLAAQPPAPSRAVIPEAGSRPEMGGAEGLGQVLLKGAFFLGRSMYWLELGGHEFTRILASKIIRKSFQVDEKQCRGYMSA